MSMIYAAGPHLAAGSTRRVGPFSPNARQNPAKHADGFTLIEMLVALVLFSSVMLTAVGSLVAIIDANRKARNQQVVMNNLNAAVENMSRTVREGGNYQVMNRNTFAFTSKEGLDIVYTLDNNRLLSSEDGGATFLPLTAPDVSVEDLSFALVPSGTGLERQSKVLVTMIGSAGERERARSTFHIQTTISQRFAQSYAQAVGNDQSPIPVCPWENRAGRTIVNFSEHKRAGTVLCNFESTWPGGSCNVRLTYDLKPEEFIQPGVYDIGLNSWDDHCFVLTDDCSVGTGHNANQNAEQFFVEFYDASDTLVFSTNPTMQDIPHEKNQVIPPEIVNQRVTIPSTITKIVAVHAQRHPTVDLSYAIDNSNSNVPACAVFDNFSSTDIDIRPF